MLSLRLGCNAEGEAMTTMNVVHMRVKPGMEDEFVRLHNDFDITAMPGGRNFWLVKSGERSFIVVGEWTDHEALVAARPAMIASLDRLRPILEDLGGGRGVTEPWSGDVALHVGG
jgi:quinol monooxygenase YgiN